MARRSRPSAGRCRSTSGGTAVCWLATGSWPPRRRRRRSCAQCGRSDAFGGRRRCGCGFSPSPAVRARRCCGGSAARRRWPSGGHWSNPPPRGRRRCCTPPRPRNHRPRAQPHGPSTPLHRGQASSPAPSANSTRSGSVSTISTGAPRTISKALPFCDESGRALRVHDARERAPHQASRTTPVPSRATAPTDPASLLRNLSHRHGPKGLGSSSRPVSLQTLYMLIDSVPSHWPPWSSIPSAASLCCWAPDPPAPRPTSKEAAPQSAVKPRTTHSGRFRVLGTGQRAPRVHLLDWWW